jgi:hypothetical protein
VKFIWEESDFKSDSGNWGLMASKGEELVIIGGLGVTSLRDGHHWKYETATDMATKFNEYGYIPVLAPINPSCIIRKAEKEKFNYGR